MGGADSRPGGDTAGAGIGGIGVRLMDKYRYRIIFDYGCYMLQTPPCTSSSWDTEATCAFAWPLHIKAAWLSVKSRWYHRADGYKREFGKAGLLEAELREEIRRLQELVKALAFQIDEMQADEIHRRYGDYGRV